MRRYAAIRTVIDEIRETDGERAAWNFLRTLPEFKVFREEEKGSAVNVAKGFGFDPERISKVQTAIEPKRKTTWQEFKQPSVRPAAPPVEPPPVEQAPAAQMRVAGMDTAEYIKAREAVPTKQPKPYKELQGLHNVMPAKEAREQLPQTQIRDMWLLTHPGFLRPITPEKGERSKAAKYWEEVAAKPGIEVADFLSSIGMIGSLAAIGVTGAKQLPQLAKYAKHVIQYGKIPVGTANRLKAAGITGRELEEVVVKGSRDPKLLAKFRRFGEQEYQTRPLWQNIEQVLHGLKRQKYGALMVRDISKIPESRLPTGVSRETIGQMNEAVRALSAVSKNMPRIQEAVTKATPALLKTLGYTPAQLQQIAPPVKAFIIENMIPAKGVKILPGGTIQQIGKEGVKGAHIAPPKVKREPRLPEGAKVPVTGKKEPWEMTEAQFKEDERVRGVKNIEEWNKTMKGLGPKSTKPSIADIIKVSESIGIDPKEGLAMGWHKLLIRQALKQGKPVPSEVLKDYPDLAKKAAKKEQRISKEHAEAEEWKRGLAERAKKEVSRPLFANLKRSPIRTTKKVLAEEGLLARKKHPFAFTAKPGAMTVDEKAEEFTKLTGYEWADHDVYRFISQGTMPKQVEMHAGINIEKAIFNVERAWDKWSGEHITQPILKRLDRWAERLTPTFRRLAVYRPGQDPKYIKWAEHRLKDIAQGFERTSDAANELLKKYPKEERLVIMDMIRGEAPVHPQYKDIVGKLRTMLDNEGAKSVKQGLLKRDTYVKNFGKYLSRMYKHYEFEGWRPENQTIENATTYLRDSFKAKNPKLTPEQLEVKAENAVNAILNGKPINIWNTTTKRPLRLDGSRFRQRKDIPEPIRDLLGEFKDPAYPFFKGMYQLSWDNPTAELFNQVKNSNLWSKTAKEGFVKLPQDPKLGALSGQYVSKEEARDIQWMTFKLPEVANRAWRLYSKGLSLWKAGKVFNPATMTRNMISNVALANNAFLSPWRVDVYGHALKEVATKGEWYRRAVADGLELRTYSYEIMDHMKKHFAESKHKHMLGKMIDITSRGLDKGIDFMGKLYEGEEAWTKLAVYINGVKNLDIPGKVAAKEAEEALFHYGKIPAGINFLRRTGIIPFPTFYYKVITQMPKWAIQRPLRFWPTALLLQHMARKSIEEIRGRKDIEKQADQMVKTILPNYMKRNKFLLLPHIDEHNRLHLLDFTYMYPYDPWELVTTHQFPYINVMANPFLTISGDIKRNKTAFSQREIWKETDGGTEKLQKMVDYCYMQLMPPLAPKIPGITKGGYSWQKIESAIMKREDWLGRKRPVPLALLDALAGIKITPIDVHEQITWRKREFDERQREYGAKRKKLLHDQRRGLISAAEADKQRQDIVKRQANEMKEHGEKLKAYAYLSKLVEELQKSKRQ